MVVIDDFLTNAAAEALVRLGEDATLFWDAHEGYVGAYGKDGLLDAGLASIAAELVQKMPAVFCGHHLEQVWAYKYDQRAQADAPAAAAAGKSGVGLHADAAAVNVNFWVGEPPQPPQPQHAGDDGTASDPPGGGAGGEPSQSGSNAKRVYTVSSTAAGSSLRPGGGGGGGGGMTVHLREAPPDWSFEEMNPKAGSDRVRQFLGLPGTVAAAAPLAAAAAAGQQGSAAAPGPPAAAAAAAAAPHVTVAHRPNRLVLFRSSLFHETDALNFRAGFKYRRINFTLLFGIRGGYKRGVREQACDEGGVLGGDGPE
eukprot:SAG22_NODE_454_length_10311_cov_4.304446_2_plen_312_part_00